MKNTVAILAAATASVSATKDIKTTSKIGQKMLSKARRVEQYNNEHLEFTWVSGMSLKFQGCFSIDQWDNEANDNEEVRMYTESFVRFRLCPSDYCSIESATGCSGGFGDYIINMETFLDAYLEAVENDQEYNCEYEKGNDCACEDYGLQEFDKEICEYECFMDKGMEYCITRNPYLDDEEEEVEKLEIEAYVGCNNYKFEGNNGNRRRLDQNEIGYFVGPYCSEDGGKIYLGLFTDDTCTQFADDYGGRETFSSLSNGASLPYSESTMVGSECMSCREPQDVDQSTSDYHDADEVKESCEQLYQAADKCEAEIDIDSPNNDACGFIQDVVVSGTGGSDVLGDSVDEIAASIFIGLFAFSVVLLGGYVWAS